MKFEKIPKITYYKFQCINKLTNETKLFLHFNSLKEYVDIPRSSFYKIIEGKEIKKFKDYEFKQIRVPKFEIRQLA
tara:strand:+ start:2225 stop:2452 length:228 start_codon:yes stop_codon:yes gene_type:complete